MKKLILPIILVSNLIATDDIDLSSFERIVKQNLKEVKGKSDPLNKKSKLDLIREEQDLLRAKEVLEQMQDRKISRSHMELDKQIDNIIAKFKAGKKYYKSSIFIVDDNINVNMIDGIRFIDIPSYIIEDAKAYFLKKKEANIAFINTIIMMEDLKKIKSKDDKKEEIQSLKNRLQGNTGYEESTVQAIRSTDLVTLKTTTRTINLGDIKITLKADNAVEIRSR